MFRHNLKLRIIRYFRLPPRSR